MHKKSKSLLIILGMPLSVLVLAAFLTIPNSYSNDIDAFCSEIQRVAIDNQLPVSHPVNKCSNQQLHKVSWSAWFAGRSSSYQFHFIDLLELLSRSADPGSSANNPAQPK